MATWLIVSLAALGPASTAGGAEPLVMADFEQGTGGWSVLTRSKEQKRGGEWSGKWSDTVKEPQVECGVADGLLLEYAGVRFSLFSVLATGARLVLRADADSGATAKPDYYVFEFVVDWEGWKEFDVPLHRMRRAREPRPFGEVSKLVLAADWLERPRPGTVLYLDDVVLYQVNDVESLVLDDMEWGTYGWARLKEVTDPVKEGKKAGLWENVSGQPNLHLVQLPGDWSAYQQLCFSLYAPEAGGSVLTLLIKSENPQTDGWDYWKYGILLDWAGWRDFRVPLKRLLAVRTPLGWDQITGMSFSATWDEAKPPEMDLVLDNVFLTPGPEPGGPLLLDDMEAGTHQWARLKEVTDPVREGKKAGLWENLSGQPDLHLVQLPSDWSAYQQLCFSLYAPEAAGSVLTLLIKSENPQTAGLDYWKYAIPLDWTGWQEFEVPFRRLYRVNDPLGWDQITRMSFSAAWDGAKPPEMDLVLDNVFLTPGPEPGGPLLLDDMEGGTHQWARSVKSVGTRRGLSMALTHASVTGAYGQCSGNSN